MFNSVTPLMRIRIVRFILFLFGMALLSPSMAVGSSLAVFPLLDVTTDTNGVNFTLTSIIRQKAADYGFEILPENEIMSFMVRNRIRNLGVLTSYDIIRLRKELAAEYALVGTVCQLSQKPRAKVSISLKLIRTENEEIVWSTVKDLHADDLISFLAISNPESLNDIYTEYFSTLMTDIPSENAEQASTREEIGLLSIKLGPGWVKSGERLDVAVRFYSARDKGDMPKIHLEIDDKIVPVQMDEDSYYFESSWQAQETPGRYKVNLVVNFGSGKRQVIELGDYTIDNTAPQVNMELLGDVIDDFVTFTEELPISLKLDVPERLSRWQVSVIDQDGETLFAFDERGQMPDRLYWNGTIDGSERVPRGIYKVVAKVWDLAGNSSEDMQQVQYRLGDIYFNVVVNRVETGFKLIVENETGHAIDFWWLKVFKESGEPVVVNVGEGFPAMVDVDYDLSQPGKLTFFIAAQDIYGNRGTKNIRDLLNIKEDVQVEYVQEKDWLENF